jgi:hypothetical protein
MHWTKALAAAVAGTALGVLAAPTGELLDLAGRVHYGYYQAEPRAVDAAIAGLERLQDSPEVAYYRDFAALRRAQLASADRASQERLRACAERDAALGLGKRFTAEAWTLVAACAHVAGDDSRYALALALARRHDDDNPRAALVDAWALMRGAETDAGRRDALAAKLEGVVAAFDAWAPSIDDPDWGHAESLTALAGVALDRGQVRTARDLIERALLLVPEYRAALDLRARLQQARAGDRQP